MSQLRYVAALVALLAIAPVGTTSTARASTERQREAIVDVPVSFEVVNKNDSVLPCPSDGGDHVVHGHLTGPRSDFEGPPDKARVISVVLTGWDEGEWTWRFRDVPGYDYAYEMARLGHTSLSIDMLGYGTSGHPHGSLLCWGSQADVTHQIIQQLRGGTYDAPTGVAQPRYSTVLVSAHDVGPLAALLDAYTWPEDIDGISTQIWAHQGFTPYIIEIFARRVGLCALGGQNHDDPRDDPDDLTDDRSRGGGYVLFGPRDEQFRSDLFHEPRSETAVVDAVVARRNRNACGLIQSNVAAIRTSLDRTETVKIPVLLVFPGPADPVITREGQEAEAANYGSDDVTSVWMDSAHFMELETCAADFRAVTARWIRERWGVGRHVAAPAVGARECVTEVRTKR